MRNGKLSLIATPIGNLEDITLRAIRTLKEADYVLCEDTRVTGKLLAHYEIKAKLVRYDAHSSDSLHERIISDVQAGQKVALVSDAGTPGISDPGVMLVQQVRSAGLKIEVIPGPSSVTAAVSLAGIAGNQFTFLGFAPQKKGRQTFFESLPTHAQPVVFLESTHRIMKTLASLAEEYPEAKVYLARELTKIYEELVVGTAGEILETFETEPVRQKGEFVLILEKND